jgi:hypothetical protein
LLSGRPGNGDNRNPIFGGRTVMEHTGPPVHPFIHRRRRPVPARQCN